MCAWCIVDSWNHDVIDELFGLADVQNQQINEITGEITGDVTYPFNFPLTLAFFQFAFMSIVFLGFWYLLSRHPAADFAAVKENIFSAHWGGLIITHVFSTFWLQSLMMPTAMMTPMVFAASRSLEVPLVAVIRSKVIPSGSFGRFGGHPLGTTALMFGAGMLLVFSQTRIAECFCMWSGHGVELAGIALFVIYGMLLILPAANAVFMESVMVEHDTNPLLMLAVVNFMACVFFSPFLIFAHCSGLENVVNAITLTSGSQQMYMLVVWLSTQMFLLSVVTFSLINMLDSFWAVSLRSFKVVTWWLTKCARIFFFTNTVLSVDKPDVSFWGFIMLFGVCLMVAAAAIDANAKDPTMEAKTEGEKV